MKRSPMTRKLPETAVCKHCKCEFKPERAMQNVCGRLCAGRYVRAQNKQKKEELRQRKEAIKTIPQLIKEAQHAFNAFIRVRDCLQPCICCGRPLGGNEVGGLYDCGHYRSTGSASHLRFHEDNAHAQRKDCNRYGAGRAVDYRIGLIRRIGMARVEALEANNEPHKWTREELTEIRASYKRKLKELKTPTSPCVNGLDNQGVNHE